MTRSTDSRALLRILGWCGYAVLLTAGAVISSAGLSPGLGVQLSDALLYHLPITLCLGGALLLSVRTHRSERLLWLLISGISVLILASEVYFTWYVTTVDASGPIVPGRFQLLQLLAVILGVAVVANMTTFGSAPRRSIVRFALDVLGGMILVAAAVYWFFVLPLIIALPWGTWQAAAVSAAYPVVGLTIVAFMGVATAGGRTYRWRSWERLITAAFLIYGAGLLVTPVFYVQLKSQSDPSVSFWGSAALGFGYYVLFMATVYRLTSPGGNDDIEPWFFPQLGPRWFPLAYPILLAAGLPVLGIGALVIGDKPEGIPITLAAVALAIVLVLRSWLMSSETVLHRRLANTDPVTGAFNDRYLRQRLASDLGYAQAVGAQLAVITFGIEGLRTIADVGGPAEVDHLLTAVAIAIDQEAGGDTTLCRSGSDVYVLIGRSLGPDAALALARKLVMAASQAMQATGVHATLSAGVAVFPAHGNDVDTLIARSSAAQSVSASGDEVGVVLYSEKVEFDPGTASRIAVTRTRSRRATTRVLAMAVDARDPDTRRHSENVADLASALALVLDLSAERAHVLDLAAQMHDVGKIGIPDAVLRIDRAFDEAQREQVEQHPALGERILASARLDEILPAVRHHHERWDGMGYPDGLSGTEIPLEARILAVCDAFESMTTAHSYGQDFSADEAVAEIRRCSGTQFDPDIAAPFCRMISQIHGASPRDRAGRSSGEADRHGRGAGN